MNKGMTVAQAYQMVEEMLSSGYWAYVHTVVIDNAAAITSYNAGMKALDLDPIEIWYDVTSIRSAIAEMDALKPTPTRSTQPLSGTWRTR